jgi:hypothetical protein
MLEEAFPQIKALEEEEEAQGPQVKTIQIPRQVTAQTVARV